MRSESTSAFGHPSETKPTVGVLRPPADARPAREAGCGSVACVTTWLRLAAVGLLVVALRVVGGPALGARAEPAARTEGAEREVAEQVAGLLLQLLLHLQEGVGALLE